MHSYNVGDIITTADGIQGTVKLVNRRRVSPWDYRIEVDGKIIDLRDSDLTIVQHCRSCYNRRATDTKFNCSECE